MAILPFERRVPTIATSAFVAPDAWVIGDVRVGDRVSIFFNAVLRGDIQPITIGEGTNLQEHVLVHTSDGMSPAVLGAEVTIGHRAIVHGCVIEDLCLIGMGATILDDARIGARSIIGAHTLIPKGVTIPPRSLVMGTPGKVIRTLTEAEEESLVRSASDYQTLGARYREIFKKAS